MFDNHPTPRHPGPEPQAPAPSAAATPQHLTLKISLRNTDISRTFVIPAHVSLGGLCDIILGSFGWDGSHLWEFQKSQTLSYIDPEQWDDDFGPGVATLDAHATPVAAAMPRRGDKLLFLYDMGDGWTHDVVRMADPKEQVARCTKSTGCYGIDDIGGPWGLMEFTERLRAYAKNPKAKLGGDFKELLKWAGLRTAKDREFFLAGPDPAELTQQLQEYLRE